MNYRSAAREWTAGILIVLLFVGAGLKSPVFLQAQNLNSIALWMPLITVVAMGEALVIIARGIDISVGSILGCSGIAVGLVIRDHPHLSPMAALALGLIAGAFLGFINAAMITWAKLPALIVTLGTLAAYRGLAFSLSGGKQIDSSMIPDSLTSLASHGPSFDQVVISILLLIALAVTLLSAFLLRCTRLGRDIFAYGGNPDAAYLRGISPNAVNLFVYTVSGALAGLAGVMYAARFGFVNPGSAGQGFELTVIAAVVIGGVKLTGGAGSVLGIFLGCLLLSATNVALSVLGIDTNWQTLSYGAIIILALVLDSVMRGFNARRLET